MEEDEYNADAVGLAAGVFGKGAESLAEVVAGLNAVGFRSSEGTTWTEASFQEEMKRLGGK